ncbi:BTB/POZ domain-containing protein KCTD2 isoform X4 [Pangasianodon hypophthalmus]|uniref:BTB/POZ domain-containing protein KCTD2 isoform X4 n=1 Tax=Pangasianodon hypophthalmus TaxID=310915 RepID=UPI002307C961|nr:BTB/POZ domain-containing protein KCTD2 isoform X4 [Pangasianodon hypophthalmus]
MGTRIHHHQSEESCDPELEEEDTVTPLAQVRPAHLEAPDGGWGWVVLVATILVLALTLAFPSCIGIFYTDLQIEFSASNSETSWVPSIMTAVLHAGGPLCSMLVEHFGCRATVMMGGVLSGLGMAASSFTHSIIELYITAGIITGSLVDSTGLYTYMFLACSITVALSALFLMVSFYWLDRRDAAIKDASPTQVSTVTPEALTVCVGEKVKEPAIETERSTTV